MTAASKAEVEKYNKNPHCNISRAPNDPFLQIAQWFEAKNYTAAKKIFFRCNKAEFHFHDFYWHTFTIHDVLYAPVFPANFLLVKYQFCSIKCCYAMVHHSWMHFLFVLQLLASRLRCCGRRPNDGQVLSTREKIIVEIMCFVTNNQRWHQREQKPIFYQHSQCLTTPKKSHLSKNNSKFRNTNP